MHVRNKILLLIFIPIISVLPAPAQTKVSSYGELQAAYMFNFAKYIHWPNEGGQFVIGIFEDANIMSELELVLQGKKVRGKEIVLKVVTTSEALNECNIVYLSAMKSRSLSTVVDAAKGKNILLVTEEDLVRKGATISFMVEDDKLKFKIKKKALDEAGLTASEGLLRLAILF